MARARVRINEAAIQALAAQPEIRETLIREAQPVVMAARAGAPKLTGAGAASIDAEPKFDGDQWVAWITWSRERYYMIFHEFGTKHMPARPFMRPALEGLTR